MSPPEGANTSYRPWAVGYKDASHFDHDFKTRFGRTPTEYRALSLRAWPNAQSDATARASPADEEGHVTDDALPGAARRVPVVDDDPGTRDTLGSRLRRGGYRVTLARSAADALEHAQSTDVEVIVLDVHLPDMDGLAALREVRRRRSLYPSVVLFTADWEVEDDAEEMLAMGATPTARSARGRRNWGCASAATCRRPSAAAGKRYRWLFGVGRLLLRNASMSTPLPRM